MFRHRNREELLDRRISNGGDPCRWVNCTTDEIDGFWFLQRSRRILCLSSLEDPAAVTAAAGIKGTSPHHLTHLSPLRRCLRKKNGSGLPLPCFLLQNQIAKRKKTQVSEFVSGCLGSVAEHRRRKRGETQRTGILSGSTWMSSSDSSVLQILITNK
ncbi:hypothetical protein MRB53_034828 [Persea americana]|uniref:Uncharacterized protein n=1 Tax=Persea americana TaxID=3435 RepID=A0ACC2K2Z7_PERAE|nr:hypothetical protein MRB53_034828 [Persea americana]